MSILLLLSVYGKLNLPTLSVHSLPLSIRGLLYPLIDYYYLAMRAAMN